MSDRYVAYVGSYTYVGKSKGITIFDVDMENGTLSYKAEQRCNNASFLAFSNSGKYLYSIIDEGVVSFEILEDGLLREMNRASIRGMRGCFIEIDPTDKYLFVAGYHDGKVTVLKLNEDGTVGEITCGIFHKGLGTSIKSGRPRVNCVKLTPDCKYLLAADGGTDHIKVYAFDYRTGMLNQVDILRCELGSGPKRLGFSNDGKFMYVVFEGTNQIGVYEYDGTGKKRPEFKTLQKLPTVDKKDISISSAITFMFTQDQKHIFVSNEGDNSICFYDRDEETGLLEKRRVSPISGEFPKGICVFPDGRHVLSCNNKSGTLTFFEMDYEKGLLIMSGRPVKVDEPNRCIMKKL